jgi:hypothetical protein
MRTILVPIEVSLVRTPDGHDRMVSKISLGHLMSDRPAMTDVDHKLSLFTEEYLAALSKCKEELHRVEEEKRKKRRVNPLHFWRIGDSLQPYLGRQSHQDSFVLRGPYSHFARDLSISKSTLQKAVTFRRRFDSPETIDTARGWDYYREARYLQDRKAKPVTKTTQQETREVAVSIKIAIPAHADEQWLATQLRRWLYGADDSTVPPRWLEEKGIRIKTYEVFPPPYEPEARTKKRTSAKPKGLSDGTLEGHSG